MASIAPLPALSEEVQTGPNTPQTVSEPQPSDHSNVPLPPTKKQYLLDDPSSTWLKSGLEHLERFQVWLGSKVQNTTENIDDYFGTEEAFERSGNSRIDVLTPVTFRDNGETEMTMKVRAKLVLPKTEKRWQLVFTSEDTSIKGKEDVSVAEEATREEENATVGAQVALEKFDKLASLLSFGVSLDGLEAPEPYVRLKKSYEWGAHPDWVTRMSHELFWEAEEGVGLGSKLVFDKRVSEIHLFRAQSDGTWWHEEEYYELTQRLLFYQELTVYRLLTYQLYGNWDTVGGRGGRLTGYGTAINWRERAYKDWLFFEVQPSVGFSKEDDFKQANLALMLMLEMRFYKP